MICLSELNKKLFRVESVGEVMENHRTPYTLALNLIHYGIVHIYKNMSSRTWYYFFVDAYVVFEMDSCFIAFVVKGFTLLLRLLNIQR